MTLTPSGIQGFCSRPAMSGKGTWPRLALAALVSLTVAACGCIPRPPVGVGGDEDPRCASDRPYAVYSHWHRSRDDDSPVGIYVANLDSATTRLVIRGVYGGYDWIPGSDSIVVVLDDGLNALSVGGGPPVPLAAGGTLWNPRVSPDGRFVACEADVGRRRDIVVLERATGVVTGVTPDSIACFAPDWMPDGSLTALGWAPSGYGLFRLTGAGAPQRLMAFGDPGFQRSPTWSPSPPRLAWADVRREPTVFVSSMSGAPPVPVAAGASVSWTHAGTSLVYARPSSTGGRLFLLDFTTGRSRQITY